jgi:hypothetical protein
MQYDISINTSQIIRWTSDLYKMNDELDKFDSIFDKQGDFKLIVDFKQLEIDFTGKQLEIEDIKYKTTKVNKDLKKEIVDLKNKSKSNLF